MQQPTPLTANDVVPIVMNTIRVNMATGYDLFLKNQVEGKICYVLYCSGEHAIRQSHLEELQSNGIQNLYIRNEDQKKYFKYIESSLSSIVKDRIDIKVKSQLVYNVAKNIMTDVFDNPRSGANVERSRGWVSGIVEHIMTNADASTNMLSMVSYDYYTYTHSVNVSVLGLLFARYIGLDSDKMDVLGTGLMLHDIGKTQIAPELVNKNGKLSNDEFVEIKKHVELGFVLLRQLGGLDEASFYAILQHHEREEGGGYPRGIKGSEIHDYGKIAKIVDVYDALTTKRSYSDARQPFNALTIMKNEMKGSFSWPYLKHFIMFLGSGGG
ncbi:MAG: hypothetical protein HW390_2644 [Candidatus Brocadiaceae bacterium]|nr:hypothetical protein [Candidatus Brocadiaceae bacterium]